MIDFPPRSASRGQAQINRFGTPTATELQSSNDMIFPMLTWPSAQARRGKLRGLGYGIRSDFELNFGRYLPAFGGADRDGTNTRPERSSPWISERGADLQKGVALGVLE